MVILNPFGEFGLTKVLAKILNQRRKQRSTDIVAQVAVNYKAPKGFKSITSVNSHSLSSKVAKTTQKDLSGSKLATLLDQTKLKAIKATVFVKKIFSITDAKTSSKTISSSTTTRLTTKSKTPTTSTSIKTTGIIKTPKSLITYSEPNTFTTLKSITTTTTKNSTNISITTKTTIEVTTKNLKCFGLSLVKGLKHWSCTDSINLGSRCFATCDNNFQSLGHFIVCSESGDWSGNIQN